jgi:cation:H+ antiporter
LVGLAARLANGFGISDLVAGLIIVAMGISAPELAVSTSAVLDGRGSVALGNVMGSNIFNFLKDGILARSEAGLFCGTTAAYLLFLAIRGGQGDEEDDEAHEDDSEDHSRLANLGKILLGIVMVIGGGKLLVTSAVALATAAGMSAWLISVTVVAAGTSAPEMVTTLSAVRSGHQGMAIGGLFGSDIFNVLLVLGVAGMVAPLEGLASYQSSVLVMAGTVLATLVLCQIRGGLARGGGALVLIVAMTRWVLDALGS